MEPALSLQRTKFNQLIQWFTGCEKQPDELFTALAGGLGITPHALIQILIVTYKKRDHNLESYLLNEELSMAQQHQYAQTINQLLASGSLLHGVTHLDPDKWMCFMQTLHDVVHDPDPLFRLNTGTYYECVSRVSEETISPPVRGMAVGDEPNERDDIGLGTAPIMLSMSPKEIANHEIQQIIHTILWNANKHIVPRRVNYMEQLKLVIKQYLENETITRNNVRVLHKNYLKQFRRTNQRKIDDRERLKEHIVLPQQKHMNIYEDAILDALAKLGGIETGGKRSRSKKRGRKSIRRRKKSIRR